MDVIITDVDDTLVCTKARWEACLEETNGKKNIKFWELYLSDKYVGLDTPIWPSIYELYRVYKTRNLPVVILSGRSDRMEKGNEFVRKLLASVGIKLYEEIYKEWEQGDETAKFKVSEIESAGYHPAFLFEDNIHVISKIREKFPDCEVYFVEDCRQVILLD